VEDAQTAGRALVRLVREYEALLVIKADNDPALTA
jgi:hypothetical protein